MELALQLIQEAKEKRLTSLELGNCGLTELPDALFELTWLEELMLGDSGKKFDKNQYTHSSIWRFGNETTIGVPNNLEKISPRIKKLQNLKSLQIYSDNMIISPLCDISALKNLSNLECLVLSSTRVSDISALRELINLQKLFLNMTDVIDISPLKGKRNLQEIGLNSTHVTDISALRELKDLRSIYLSGGKVTDISPLKDLVNLKSLELSSTEITDISALKDLVNLKSLELSSTQITDISALKDLVNLRRLNLSYLGVKNIDALKGLVNLQTLRMTNTYVSDLNPLKNLLNLNRLDIALTNVRDLNPLKKIIEFNIDSFSLGFQSCPFPKSLNLVLYKDFEFDGAYTNPNTNKALLNYLNKPKKYLFEARVLILGEPRSGKTTLRRKLKSAIAPMPSDKESTKAFDIEIEDYCCEIRDSEGKIQKMLYRIWDFGGQDYYRLLHQLFVTEQSVYIIVTDTDRNKNEEEIDFWLETIERLGKDREGHYSPVILFQNPKTNREGSDFSDLKKRYKFWQQPDQYVINLDKIDAKNVANFDEKELKRFNGFKNYLEESFSKLPHVGKEMPIEWINIRKALDKKQKENWITREDFDKICASKGMTDPEEQEDLLDIFRMLGFLLHYKDSALKGKVILNKEWVTNALYRVLDDGIVTKNKGWFRKEDAEKIWFEPQYKHATEELLALMRQFKLSYFNEVSKKYIVPAKLSDSTDGLPEWNTTDNVHLRLQYDWMPRAIATQLTVSLHNDLVTFENGEQWIWRKGAVLDGRRLDLKNTQVRIEDNWKENRIDITARGASSEFLIREVMRNWRDVHQPFEEKTEVTKVIFCKCTDCTKSSKPHQFKYENVLKFLENKKTLQCNESGEDFYPKDILRGVFDDTTVSVDEDLKRKGQRNPEIKRLIASGDLEEVFNQLPKDDNTVIKLKLWFSQLIENRLTGQLSYEQARSEEQKIANGLLQFLDKDNDMERMKRDRFER